jgi:hypothetical protein
VGIEMNERIRKLAEQAGFFPVPDDTEWDWEYRAENARYEKFAELIVKECMTVSRGADGLDATHEAWYLIQEHFGVEE